MKLFLLCLFLTGFIQAATTYKDPIEFSSSTTSAVAMPENKYRCYLIMMNKGAESVYVKFGSAHTGTEGILITAGGIWEPMNASGQAIYIKSASGTPLVSLIQGNCNQ